MRNLVDKSFENDTEEIDVDSNECWVLTKIGVYEDKVNPVLLPRVHYKGKYHAVHKNGTLEELKGSEFNVTWFLSKTAALIIGIVNAAEARDRAYESMCCHRLAANNEAENLEFWRKEIKKLHKRRTKKSKAPSTKDEKPPVVEEKVQCAPAQKASNVN